MKNSFLFLLLFTLSVFNFKCQAQDTQLEWVKTFGSTTLDMSGVMIMDSMDNVYTIGHFTGMTDFDPGIDTLFIDRQGASDIFIQKLDSAGNFVWVKTIGGLGLDFTRAIALDLMGNIIITGKFQHTVDFDPGLSEFNLTANGDEDSFILKLNSSGAFIWVKSMDLIPLTLESMEVDDNGNIYMAGAYTAAADANPGAGTSMIYPEGGLDMYILKFDSAGEFEWVESIGGVGSDYATSMVFDANEDLLLTGYYSDSVNFNPGHETGQWLYSNGPSLFILKLAANGDFEWVKSTEGPGISTGLGIGTNNFEEYYIRGWLDGTEDFDFGLGTYNLTTGAGLKCEILMKIDAQGNLLWVKKMMESSNLFGLSDFDFDQFGNLYLAGSFDVVATFNPEISPVVLPATTGMDVFLMKVNSVGDFIWVKGLYGPISQECRTLILDDLGDIYYSGSFVSTVDFNLEMGTHYMTSNNVSHDIFISRLSQCMVDDGVTIAGSTITANSIGISYQWIDCSNNSIIQNATSQSFSPSQNGTYAVQIDMGNCTGTSICTTINNVGLEENTDGNSLTIFPNPSNGIVHMDLSSFLKEITVNVYTMQGQSVFEKIAIQPGIFSFELDVEAGYYLVELVSKDKRYFSKLIIE